MRLYDHVTGTEVAIADLTIDALHTHLARTDTEDWASLEQAYPVYRARREALESEARRRSI